MRAWALEDHAPESRRAQSRRASDGIVLVQVGRQRAELALGLPAARSALPARVPGRRAGDGGGRDRAEELLDEVVAVPAAAAAVAAAGTLQLR